MELVLDTPDTPVEIWGVRVSAEQNADSINYASGRYITPYFFQMYSGNASNDDSLSDVWTSDTYQTHPVTGNNTDADKPLKTHVFDTPGTGTVLRLARDLSVNPATTSMNIYEVEAYGRMDAAVLHFDLLADGSDNDKIFLMTGGTLNLEDAILNLSLLGTPEEMTWTLFGSENDAVSDWSSMLGGLSLGSLPTIAGFMWDTSDFYALGQIGLMQDIGAVPEPATWVMLMLGAAAMLLVRRRSA